MNKAGIYIIKNKINGKVYVGKDLFIDKLKRIKEHRLYLNENKHYNEHLQRSWNENGEENFEFKVLEETIIDYDREDVEKIIETNKLLEEKEIDLIKHYQSNNELCGYNKTSGGNGIVGFRSIQRNKKIGDAQRGEKNHASRLTWEIVNNIREIFLSGERITAMELEKKHGVKASQFSKIFHNKKWYDEEYGKKLESKRHLLNNKKAKNPRKGDTSHFSKLTKKDVDEIREDHLKGSKILPKEWAKIFGVNTYSIHRIIKNETFKDEEYAEKIKQQL